MADCVSFSTSDGERTYVPETAALYRVPRGAVSALSVPNFSALLKSELHRLVRVRPVLRDRPPGSSGLSALL